MAWRDPCDDLASDIIGSGGEDSGMPARWPRLARVSPAGRSDRPAVAISSVMAGTVAPGGVFAEGGADRHPWQLAVRDIAAPGFGCQPGVTLNGNDATRCSRARPCPHRSAAWRS
jgi:hypothetical protein